MTMEPIYLDHQATTPCDERVFAAMLPYFSAEFGNPSSRTTVHGQRAEAAVDRARRQVAEGLGGQPHEITFTSGATEANNLVLRGLAARLEGGSVVSQPTEHASVLEPLRALSRAGVRVRMARIDRTGRLDPGRFAELLDERPRLAVVMAANNEIGTLQDLELVARMCRERGVPLHVDAAQAVGKVPLDAAALGVDYLTLSAHKLYGPKGVGALYMRRRSDLPRPAPQLLGGGQEEGQRSGTLNVPGIVGLGEAVAVAVRDRALEAVRLRELRDRLLGLLMEGLDGVSLNGHPEHRLAGNLNVSIEGVDGDALLLGLKGLSVSSGSACESAAEGPSHVLLACGLTPEEARASLRMGLGRGTDLQSIERAAEIIIGTVRRLRQRSPLPRGRHDGT